MSSKVTSTKANGTFPRHSPLLTCCLLLIAFSPPALADPGDLDPSFGVGGKVVTDFFGASDRVSAISLLGDGRIVAVGFSQSLPFGRYDVSFARYLPNGVLDSTFDLDGKTMIRGGLLTDLVTRDAALQSDGKIVMGGEFWDSLSRSSILLARLDLQGKRDTSFDGDGIFVSDLINTSAMAVAIQDDGKIVIATPCKTPCGYFGGQSGLALMRFHTNGVLDSTFGKDGIASAGFGVDEGENIFPYDVAIQSDGKIVVAGDSHPIFSTERREFALARFEVDGALDTTFGTSGKVNTRFGEPAREHARARALAIQADGKIVAVGYVSSDLALASYLPDGSLDRDFGNGGILTTDLGGEFDTAGGVAIQRDCKIVVAAVAKKSLIGPSDFVVARYEPDGNLDRGFGVDGIVTTDFGPTRTQSGAASVIIQADGKILAGGGTGAGLDYDFALARYESRSTTPSGLLEDLIGLVDCFQLAPGIENSLRGKLERARDTLSEGDSPSICGHLRAFVNQVDALAPGKFVSEEQGQQMIWAGEEIEDLLNCR